MGGLNSNALMKQNLYKVWKRFNVTQYKSNLWPPINQWKTIQMRNTSVEDSGYYYCELMVRGKEPIIEEVTKLTGTVPSSEMLPFFHVEHA